MGEFLLKSNILVIMENKRPYYICCYVPESDGSILIHHQHLVHPGPGEQPPVVQHGNRTTVQVPPVPMEQDKFIHSVETKL